VKAAGTPATRRVRFDPGPVVLEGCWPAVDGVDVLYSPRRTILDKLLVDAAREAGAEVRERFAVDEIVLADGRVAGIRGRERGSEVRERARLVVGADGRHSLVAKAVRAAPYHARQPLSIAYYTYWTAVPTNGREMYARERRMIGAWPTNDGQLMTYVAAPAAEFRTFKSDPEGSLLRSLDLAGDLGERVRAGERAERIDGTADLQNRFHVPHGPGWALVGDASLVMDPITGQGISDAFRDAELLVDAIAAGLDGGRSIDGALAEYQRERDRAALAMYQFTAEVASFAPPRPEQLMLLDALSQRPREVDRFLGVLAGAVPIGEFFGPRHLLRLLGPRRMLKAGRARRRIAA
jgi:2-polyprenyl-6-methoxyphenol hydroxylase-like FAD-dependent oxidoreductase